MFKRYWRIWLGAIVIVVIVGSTWLLQPQMSARQAQQRVVVTTVGLADIFAKLDIPVVGVPTTTAILAASQKKLPKVGDHVTPNFEKIISLKPDVVYVDASLVSDYRPKLQAHKIRVVGVDMGTAAKQNKAILHFGKLFKRTTQARQLVQKLRIPTAHPKHPVSVLVLLGMPGGQSMVATSQSYVGDLVVRAGGKLIQDDQRSAYTILNSETILKTQPQVIIRVAHAMPEIVQQQFNDEFKTGIWPRLPAVQKHQVYDGRAPKFSPSANDHVQQTYQQIKAWIDEANK